MAKPGRFRSGRFGSSRVVLRKDIPVGLNVVLVVDGQSHVMRLTLGALAELETGLESGSLVDLVQRFESGGFSTRDVLALIVAGLRGGRLDRSCV